jgi:hypothetical protein
MQAFLGEHSVKEKYLQRVRAHRLADEIVKGRYWENGKGCAVGCTIHASDHSAFERELGIPQGIAHLEDAIFEMLPNEQALLWPEQFLEAIYVGADLSLVGWKFLAWLVPLTLERYGNAEVTKSCQPAIVVLRQMADGKVNRMVAWVASNAASNAAKSAAKSAAHPTNAAPRKGAREKAPPPGFRVPRVMDRAADLMRVLGANRRRTRW